MKMGFLFSGVFWGVVLLLLGVSVILKATLHINIPVFRIVLGLIVVWLGVSILAGRGCSFPGKDWGGNRSFKAGAQPEREYNTLFGASTIDLREVALSNERVAVKVSTVFGSAKVLLDADKPVAIKGSAVFGRTALPDGNEANFGDTAWRSPGYSETNAALLLEVSTVFGETVVLR